MATPRLHSAKRIEQQFHTGEEPVMVMCSDINIYVCKYMRSSATAYKLACEFIGAKFATTCANLMYDVVHEQLVSIDYGCIFNTATFDAPFSQLTSTDTILWSDLFKHLLQGTDRQSIYAIADRLKANYEECLTQSKRIVKEILTDMPQEWKVPNRIVSEKLGLLFEEQWITQVWKNFMDCLNENIE